MSPPLTTCSLFSTLNLLLFILFSFSFSYKVEGMKLWLQAVQGVGMPCVASTPPSLREPTAIAGALVWGPSFGG